MHHCLQGQEKPRRDGLRTPDGIRRQTPSPVEAALGLYLEIAMSDSYRQKQMRF
jgi:hypothetical protein